MDNERKGLVAHYLCGVAGAVIGAAALSYTGANVVALSPSLKGQTDSYIRESCKPAAVFGGLFGLVLGAAAGAFAGAQLRRRIDPIFAKDYGFEARSMI